MKTIVTYQVVALEGLVGQEAWGGRMVVSGALRWDLNEHRVFVTMHGASYGPDDILGEVKDFFRHGDRIMAEIHWLKPEYRSLNTTIIANNVVSHASLDNDQAWDNIIDEATIREVFLAAYLPWGDEEMDPGFPKTIDYGGLELPKVPMPKKD